MGGFPLMHAPKRCGTESLHVFFLNYVDILGHRHPSIQPILRQSSLSNLAHRAFDNTAGNEEDAADEVVPRVGATIF